MSNSLKLSLYYFESCPFCQRVLRVLPGLKLNVELCNIHEKSEYFDELVQGGGKSTVPCLKIESQGQVKWLYESLDIIDYLKSVDSL